MRSGRAIAGEREKVESDSQRERVRRRAKRKKVFSGIFVAIFVVILVGLAFKGGKSLIETIKNQEETEVVAEVFEPTVEIIDEVGRGKVSKRVLEYIGQAEFDFRDLGIEVSRVVLPLGMAREVDFYVEGFSGYIKLNIDRGTAVSVEDADRMLRYLKEEGIESVEYIDVRVAGKGFYK